MANGVPKKVKRLKSGCIFIIVDQKHQNQNLLRTTKLMNHYPVKVSPHKYLNSTKCVIQSRELNNMEESYIAEELRSQGVIAVKRISVRYDLYCLTINGQSQSTSTLDIWKHALDLISQTLKDVFNATNLVIQRTPAKAKLFVLDAAKKDML